MFGSARGVGAERFVDPFCEGSDAVCMFCMCRRGCRVFVDRFFATGSRSRAGLSQLGRTPRAIAAPCLYRKHGSGRKREVIERFADRRKRGPKPPRSVFVRQHEREHRRNRVARADVEFERMLRSCDDDPEVDETRVARFADGNHGHKLCQAADYANCGLVVLRMRAGDVGAT